MSFYLDVSRLWNQATLSLATYNQLAIVANSQLSEARRATLELLDLVGYAGATEPYEGLGSAMTTMEGREFVYSLLAMVSASDLPDDMAMAALSAPSFGVFEDLPQGGSSSEEEEEEEDDGDQGIPIEIDRNSPPRELTPPPPVASSSRAPALMPVASYRSLRSHGSGQISSAAHSSSSNVDSPRSAVSKGSKKRSKSLLLLFLIFISSLMPPIYRIGQVRLFHGGSWPSYV